MSVLIPEFRSHHRHACNFIDLFTLLALGLQNCEINWVRMSVTGELIFLLIYLLI